MSLLSRWWTDMPHSHECSIKIYKLRSHINIFITNSTDTGLQIVPIRHTSYANWIILAKDFTFHFVWPPYLFSFLIECLSDEELRAMRPQNELSPLQFVSKYVSLIVLKLQFLQANFEEIYQKHVRCPSWQALPAWGNQIFRANFKRWTNRQPLIGPTKQPSNHREYFQGHRLDHPYSSHHIPDQVSFWESLLCFSIHVLIISKIYLHFLAISFCSHWSHCGHCMCTPCHVR